MAVFRVEKNKNYTVMSNVHLKDKRLALKTKGLLSIMLSLPDDWDYSERGLCAITGEGKDSIKKCLKQLETYGYLIRRQLRKENGHMGGAEYTIYEEPKEIVSPRSENPTSVNPISDNLASEDPISENPPQLNTENQKNTKRNNQSINQSNENAPIDRETEIRAYKDLIADNIKLDWLLDKSGDDEDETEMVREIYDVVCDMVCYPRETVVIKGTEYPWEAVKSRFLKLRHEHVANLLNRLIDADLGIRNMSAYLVSSLYAESMVGTIDEQASLHDDYLKYLRGKPY